MASSSVGARHDIIFCAGDDLSRAITVTENGVAYSFTGAAVTTQISATQGGAAVATNFTQNIASNVLTLSLTETQTATLGVGTFFYWVKCTKAGITRTWLAGQLSVRSADDGDSPSQSAVSLSLTDVSIALEITAATSPTGAQILALIQTDLDARYAQIE